MNRRRDFPIFKNNPGLVYLDSGATSQKPQRVIDAITEFYSTYNSNIHRGLYPIAEKASAQVEEVRKKVTKFINAHDSSEIIFTKGTTEGINLVMYTWGDASIKAGDRIVTTLMDHHANFVPWQQLAKKKKATFEVVGITGEGKIDEKDLQTKAKGAKILALPYVSNVLGSINYVSDLIQKIRLVNPDIVVVVDGAQAVPFKPVDVQKLDCDFFVFSGHKMYAETGVGILYAKKKFLDMMPPFLYGGDMIKEVSIDETTFADSPGRYEGGTPNISGIVSLGAAIDYMQNIGMEKIKAHERALAVSCINQLKKIDGVTIFGPKKSEMRSNVVSFIIEGIHPHDIAQVLADNTICVRAGHHCTMPLHKALGVPASVRVSFGIYNNEEDITKFIREVKYVKKIFKKR